MKTARTYYPKIFQLMFFSGLMLTAGCDRGNNQVSRSGRGIEATPVEALVIRPQLLENKIYATGTLLANEEVELRPEISGRVVGVYFEEGRKVKKGGLLLKINDRELQAQLKRKRLEETLAADEEHRKRSLLEINGISREEYDKALNALNMIKAEREVIESQLEKTEIKAPFDGIIGLRYVSEGSYISPSTLAATMQNIDPVKVEFSVPEKYTRLLKRGSTVMVQVGETATRRRGEIYAVEAKVDLATRTIKARATIPNPDGHLIPGSFAKVEITLEKITEAVVIPTQALIPELEGEKVFICENGLAKSIPVTTGIRTERDIQIREGLQFGDTLITTGLLQLTDGKAVRITNLKNE